MVRIAIIVGSTRPGRRAEMVARWVNEVAAKHAAAGHGEATYEILDLADFALPMLDEPVPAAIGDYRHAHTKRWAEAVGSFDGFIFVTPEYNHSIPGALKNAIDFLFAEWNDKAAGFVSYGLAGGIRAVEHLRLVLAEVKVVGVRSQVGLSLSADFDITDMAEPGVCTPDERQESTLVRMLDELSVLSAALQTTRPVETHLQGRRVLVIGRSPATNQSVVEPLVALGIDAVGTTQPEEAGGLFDAKDFERIVFGRGVLGSLSDQLKRDFARQNPDVRFVDAIAPVAVKQTVASLAQDPVRRVSEFRVINDGEVDRILATVLTPCHVTLTSYREIGGTGLAEEIVAELDVDAGAFEQQIDSGRLARANSLLLTADEQEYHLHPFLAGG